METYRLFSDIAQEAKLNLIELAQGHLYRFSKGEFFFNVCGYYFDNNPSGAVEICRDKQLTSDVLSHANILNVTHKTFLSPLEEGREVKDFIKDILIYSQKFGYRIVCKPPKTANGVKVYFCTTLQDVEKSVLLLVKDSQDVCVSPYVDSEFEYRVYILNGKAKLIYRKEKPFITKEEKNKLQKYVADTIKRDSFKSYFDNFFNHSYTEEDRIYLTNQHNLSKGAQAFFEVEKELREKLVTLALKVASSLGIIFCSIDFLHDEMGRLLVLEVNPGIMTRLLIAQHGEKGYQAAKSMYKEAVVSYFNKMEERNEIKKFAY